MIIGARAIICINEDPKRRTDCNHIYLADILTGQLYGNFKLIPSRPDLIGISIDKNKAALTIKFNNMRLNYIVSVYK